MINANDLYYDDNEAIKFIKEETALDESTITKVLASEFRYMQSVGIIEGGLIITKREAAIVSAYTGYLIGEFSDFHAYAEEVMGRPVLTHELLSISEELKNKSKNDFMSIKIEENKALAWIYHIPEEIYGIVDFDAIENVLGFRLFSWQKSYILTGSTQWRIPGKSTAMILRELFNREQYNNPIDFTYPPRTKRDHVNRQQFRDIWEKLQDAGVPMRPVFWTKEDKKKYNTEHYDPYKYARTWLDEYWKGE